MNIINNLRDLDRLVATSAFCPEPLLSERRAIHESGAWRWVCPGDYPAGSDRDALGRFGHWKPVPFSTCPAASYALEQKMRAAGYAPSMVDYWSEGWRVSLAGTRSAKSPTWHESRLIAMCLAALRALKVEFELQLDWDAKP